MYVIIDPGLAGFFTGGIYANIDGPTRHSGPENFKNSRTKKLREIK